MAQTINMAVMSVQTVTNSSGVFCGKNLHTAWKAVTKQNQGCGVIGGDGNLLSTNLNTVQDNDLLDSYVPQEKATAPDTGYPSPATPIDPVK